MFSGSGSASASNECAFAKQATQRKNLNEIRWTKLRLQPYSPLAIEKSEENG